MATTVVETAATAEVSTTVASVEAITASEDVVANGVDAVMDMVDDNSSTSVEVAVTNLVSIIIVMTGNASVGTDVGAELISEGFDFDTLAVMIECSDLDAQSKEVSRAGLIGA